MSTYSLVKDSYNSQITIDLKYLYIHVSVVVMLFLLQQILFTAMNSHIYLKQIQQHNCGGRNMYFFGQFEFPSEEKCWKKDKLKCPLNKLNQVQVKSIPCLCSSGLWESIRKYWLVRVGETESDTGASTHSQVHIQVGVHTFSWMNAKWCCVLMHMQEDGLSPVVSWSGTGEVADTHSGGIFAIKVGPVAIFPLTAQAKYQGMVLCCFAPLVELIRCSQRTALSSHCSAHNTALVALWGKQLAKITQWIT